MYRQEHHNNYAKVKVIHILYAFVQLLANMSEDKGCSASRLHQGIISAM